MRRSTRRSSKPHMTGSGRDGCCRMTIGAIVADATVSRLSVAFHGRPCCRVANSGSVWQWPLFGPGVVQDDLDEVVADECGVEVLENIVVHRAEGAVRAV